MRRNAWRRHHRLVIGYIAFFVVLVGLFGGARLHAYSASERSAEDEREVDVDAAQDLFDFSTLHSMRVSFDEEDYARAVDAYLTKGEKNFFPADVLIDGVLVRQVGLRLKGNSSLADLATRRTQPEQLPWLLSFDEYVRDRTFDGHQSIAFRTAKDLTPQTVANEAVSMRLIDTAGAPGSDVTYTTLRMNDGATALRLVVEAHDAGFGKHEFAHKGVLYKALSSGRFAYLGEDPLAYADAFRQLTRRNKQDLQPLIDLLRWVQESDDATFAAGIDDRVDLDAFASYLALQNLLLNPDDMAGKGQNYTLFYDLHDDRFTVVTWDMNEAFTDDVQRAGSDHGAVSTNLLVQRILATPGFAARYEGAFAALSTKLYAEGAADDAVDDVARVLAAVPDDVLAPRTVAAELDALREVIRRRTAALAAR